MFNGNDLYLMVLQQAPRKASMDARLLAVTVNPVTSKATKGTVPVRVRFFVVRTSPPALVRWLYDLSLHHLGSMNLVLAVPLFLRKRLHLPDAGLGRNAFGD